MNKVAEVISAVLWSAATILMVLTFGILVGTGYVLIFKHLRIVMV
jgi:hypothetical protein